MPLTLMYGDETPYGYVQYFISNRFWNTESFKEMSKITSKEIVSFDVSLFDMKEIKLEDMQSILTEEQQLLATITRPDACPEMALKERHSFEFCGYDLVEDFSKISAITGCCGGFEAAVHYNSLNKYGLITNYKEAIELQIKLREEYPDEEHAYCDVVEVWRKLVI